MYDYCYLSFKFWRLIKISSGAKFILLCVLHISLRYNGIMKQVALWHCVKIQCTLVLALYIHLSLIYNGTSRYISRLTQKIGKYKKLNEILNSSFGENISA